MLTINKNLEGDTLKVILEGRLDTNTSPELEEEIKDLSGVKTLIMDFSALEYISSAGLRVLLAAQKTMNTQGVMKVTNVNDTIKEIFDVTGFAEILTIE